MFSRHFISFIRAFILLVTFSSLSTSSSAQTTLIHYWNFNRLTITDTFPKIPLVKADYSIVDTNKAYMLYTFGAGTSTKSMDSAWIDNVAGTTVNAQQGAAAGNCLRVRNPTDFSQLWFYMPTPNYQGISVSFALESSSVKSGPEVLVFAYSVDSGVTWKTSGLTVNGSPVDTLKDTGSVYQGSSFGLVTLGFGTDTTVNNNTKLVLSISFKRDDTGAVAGTSGNDRIDNIAVQAGPVPKTITISSPGGNSLYSGQKDTILYTTTGIVSRKKSYFYSLDSGNSWSSIGSDTGIVIGSGFGFIWTVPTVYDPTSNVMIAISDSENIKGYSSVFTILPFRLLQPPSNLMYYWHFNAFNGTYNYSNMPTIPPDYTTLSASNSNISFQLNPGAPVYSYLGYVEGVPGTGTNTQMGYPADQALEIGNPSDSVQMVFYIPSTNHENIQLQYALQTAGSNFGPVTQQMDYSTDSGRSWRTTALKQSVDTINHVSGWQLMSVDLSSDLYVDDNPDLVFRLRFVGNNSSNEGYVRVDNVTVLGEVGQVTIPGAPVLVHYWNFNQFGGPYSRPVPKIDADYSLIDTAQAYLEYYVLPGTSSTWSAGNSGGCQIDNVASADVGNLRMGAVSGLAMRARNPVDSSELRWHIPSTGYTNLTVKFAVESSSTTSGDSTQVYSYSVDGGNTWKSASITVNGAVVDTLDVTQPQYQGSSWGLVTVTFGSDPTVNNNPNLIFRIVCRGNTHLLSGNNRYDDFTLDGIPVSEPPVLVHYWNFNQLGGPYSRPVPKIDADYSLIDTSKAYLEYYVLPGTSSAWAAGNNGSCQVDNVASGDSTNLRLGAVPGLAMRARNPVDSSELRWHIPSTGYMNLVVKFAVESSSTTSGDSTQVYSYSTDGGETWNSADLTVDGSTVDTLSTTGAQYQGTSWGLVTVTFGSDTTVNNNPNLIFRIVCRGNTHLLSGNNRYDDFTVDGVAIGSSNGQQPPPPPGTITVSFDGFTLATPVDTVYTGTQHTITYTVSGTVTSNRTVEYSLDGVDWAPIATISGLSYDWTVPLLTSSHAYVRVVDGKGVVGTSERFVIVDSGKIKNVWMYSNNIPVGEETEVIWYTTGYVGQTVNIDLSTDGKKTWTPIVANYAWGVTTVYRWTAPTTPDSNLVIRLTFANGLVGYTAPFNVYVPLAGVVASQQVPTFSVWPNPLQSQATIAYTLPESGAVTFILYDVTGREIETIDEGEQAAGDRQIVFDGSRIAAGTYPFEVMAGQTIYRGEMVVIH